MVEKIIILCQNFENHKFFSKIFKKSSICAKNFKISSFFAKIWKIIIFCQNLKNHQFLQKFLKIINFCKKNSKYHNFCENLKKSSFFAKIFIYMSITLVSPVSRDQSHSLSIAIVLRYWGDTGMSKGHWGL